MNERNQLWIILEAIFICVVFASLYAIGGSGDFFGGEKWIRRYLAPAIFCVWAFVRSGLDWRYLVQMGPMMGALCLPYGSDTLWGKIAIRGVFGVANGIAGTITNAWHKRYVLTAFHIGLVTITSIVMGAFNPLPNAMVEQFVIGFVIIFIPAMSVQRRK